VSLFSKSISYRFKGNLGCKADHVDEVLLDDADVAEVLLADVPESVSVLAAGSVS
jgi:hypothetical protein